MNLLVSGASLILRNKCWIHCTPKVSSNFLVGSIVGLKKTHKKNPQKNKTKTNHVLPMVEEERASGASNWLCNFTKEFPEHGKFLALGRIIEALNLRYSI